MARQKKMQFYLSQLEYTQLQEYADEKEISMAEVLRDYIKTLPQPKKNITVG
ncbi:CopG domain protein DNA-binding domain protein [Kalymmatonema gypsitolerans NIES-4073]|nr:CopG domain protein DNA-binding domain protein [Scytonema sp. NIES-4073]